MSGSIANLRRNGFDPQTVLDGGAYSGLWTQEVAAIFPDARFHMFEAQPKKAPFLEAVATKLGGRATYSISLLGAECMNDVAFHQMETGSSVLSEMATFARETAVLPMTTMDEIVTREGLKPPYFLKLDVQGFELEVIKGAKAIPKGCGSHSFGSFTA
jgi:FkbM family methyltransferase